MPQGNLLDRVRRLALRWPDTEESSRLGGEPHFYVNGKIFAGCGQEGGSWVLGVKVGLEMQSLLITRPGFRVAKYVGRYGWVSVDDEAIADQEELERLVRLSYELIVAGAPSARRRQAPRQSKKPQPRRKAR